jgi:hypothetical protein
MTPRFDSLNNLAQRARQGDDHARQSLRQELEQRLVPLIRCALRTGAGLPALVKWVRSRVADLADSESLDPRQAAARFARLFCANLEQGLPAFTAHDTIRGP